MKSQVVLIKRLVEHAIVPTYGRDGDVGFDFYASEDTYIEPGQTVAVPTGIAFQIPQGYEIQIRPRSGLSASHKLRIPNAPGTVDTGYRGEVKVLVENTNYEGAGYDTQVRLIDGTSHGTFPDHHRKGTYLVRRGDRIVQGVLNEAPRAIFEEVDEVEDSERGDKGFGSTGVN